MAIYLFKRAISPPGFLANARLGTDVLNALGALANSGQSIEFDAETMVETADEVRIEVTGRPRLQWHQDNDVSDVFGSYGVQVETYTESDD